MEEVRIFVFWFFWFRWTQIKGGSLGEGVSTAVGVARDKKLIRLSRFLSQSIAAISKKEKERSACAPTWEERKRLKSCVLARRRDKSV